MPGSSKYIPGNRRPANARVLLPDLPPALSNRILAAEAAATEPFRGITTNGNPIGGLFPLPKVGTTTSAAAKAAYLFLDCLPEYLRTKAQFDLEANEWMMWSNIHVFLMRHGVLLEELGVTQRQKALSLIRSALSNDGFALVRNVMRLNETTREITGRSAEYGEWLYWLSVMGQPSPAEPWGWQLDGHHLNINCFNLAGNIVMTPTFLGAEPVLADAGSYEGTHVFSGEESAGLALMRSLPSEQQGQAILSDELPNEVFAGAGRDNMTLGYEGVRYTALSSPEQSLLLDIVTQFAKRLRQPHRASKLAEVYAHLETTYFAWAGGYGARDPFYYRIQSPVILIEFDHQGPVALGGDGPSRQHIHTMIRTPNGGDYGKDLLRQHRISAPHG